MKWHRPQCCYTIPNPSLYPGRTGGLSTPLYSDNGRFVCAEYLVGADTWAIVENPLPHFLIDGADFAPIEAYYYGGGLCWEGNGADFDCLHYSPAHNAWILRAGTPYGGGVPTAYKDWATGQWTGGAWYESADLNFGAGAATTLAPKGTLLNDANAASKTAQIYLPRWEWESDGYSRAPIGKYVGKDGLTGIKYIGAAAYVETGTNYAWFRKGEGRSAYLQRENADEQSTPRRNFRGFGYGWGISRGDLAYLAAALPAGEEGATFNPFRWDEEANAWVQAEDEDPIEMTYRGRTMGREVVDGYFTEVALWR